MKVGNVSQEKEKEMSSKLWGKISLKQALRAWKETKWEVGCDEVTWIDLSQDEIQYLALVLKICHQMIGHLCIHDLCYLLYL